MWVLSWCDRVVLKMTLKSDITWSSYQWIFKIESNDCFIIGKLILFLRLFKIVLLLLLLLLIFSCWMQITHPTNLVFISFMTQSNPVSWLQAKLSLHAVNFTMLDLAFSDNSVHSALFLLFSFISALLQPICAMNKVIRWNMDLSHGPGAWEGGGKGIGSK